MHRRTLDDFEARIARVLRLIVNHIDEPPSLAQLASEAALSPFHFHRVWRAVMGEPIMETVRRLRLELAAHRLAATSVSVSQVALETGFGSSQTFARAFRRATGRTPSEARRGGVDAARPARGPIDSAMSVEIVTLEPFTVIAKRRIGACRTRDLGPTFGAVWSWANSNGYLPRVRGIYAMRLDDPMSVPPEDVRYDAGFDFGPGLTPADDMHLVRIPGGDAARIRVHGPYTGLETAYDTLYGLWLPSSGRELADVPLVNRFYNDPDVTPEAELITDALLPLVGAQPSPDAGSGVSHSQ